jgi:23S rRNA (adenine2503-C2)-methyltransferase
MRRLTVPTGDICIIEGERGRNLEFLSVGDYGKANNIKARFLGLHDDIHGVEHGPMMPLSEKWVVTISTQYGCSMGCTFCDVPMVGRGANATYGDLIAQVEAAVALHPEITYTDRLNLHFARMGEPTFNLAVLDAAWTLADRFGELGWGYHPVVSTMMPRRNKNLDLFLRDWLTLKRALLGNAGLQLSINTTDDAERDRLFGGESLPLATISAMLKDAAVVGRKIALNFALAGAPIDADRLRSLFDPERFMCKITPMHKTAAADSNGLDVGDSYRNFHPYAEHEQALVDAGFDVIVFVPSEEEDLGRITCGNAILSGSLPEVPYTDSAVGE